MSLSPPNSSVALVGATPVLQLTRFDTGPCSLFTLAADKHTSEYRDELARLAVDVATRRGGTEELALRLAERSLT
jgi:cystathionine beta-synthase